MTSGSSSKESSRGEAPLRADSRVLVGEGDVVGVVLFGLGGPASADEIEAYLYEVLMDPLRVRLGWLPLVLRKRVARFLAHRRAEGLAGSLKSIGGAAPDLRLLRDQARALEQEFKRQADPRHGFTLRVYTANRYGTGGAASAIAKMRTDGVTRVVLVPTAPVCLTAMTETCVKAWRAAAREAEYEHVPTTVVWEYAHSPAYVQALSDRLDETLQRFPRALRADVQLVFALHPASALDSPDGTPERTPLAPLVDTLRHQRVESRLCHYAYVQNWGLSRQPSPSLLEVFETIAASGCTGVVVVPVGFTTDTMETAYELDVVLRAHAEALGLQQYEISAALNCNALFLQALVENIGNHIRLGDVPGDGVLVPLPAPPTVAPRDARL